MEQKLTSHIFKGCFIAILYIIFNTIVFYAKIKDNYMTDFIAWAVVVAGSLFSVYFYGKLSNTTQTFGTLFSHGFKTIAVATCFIFIYVLAMLYIINSKQIIVEADRAAVNAQKQGVINGESQIVDFKNNFIKVYRLMNIALTVMGTLFLGIIGSLLGAVITPKKAQQTN